MEGPNSHMTIDLIGNIYVIDEIIYYDKLLSFSCKNDIGNLFLAICIELDDMEQWLFLPVSEARLIQILRGSITAYKAFEQSEMGFIWKITIHANYNKEGKAEKISFDKLADVDLPDKDILFDVYGEDTFSIKRSKQEKILEQSIKERREIIDISLELEQSHTHEIGAAFLGNVLKGTQDIVNVISHRQGMNASIPKKIKDDNKLIYTGNYAASFGIRLKSNKLADIFNESELQRNLSVLMSLLKAKSNAEEISEITKELNPKVLSHYKNFLNLFQKEDVAINTNLAFPSNKLNNVKLTSEDIAQSIKVLESEINETSKEYSFYGKIVAIDITRNNFKFITDDDDTISGEIDKAVNIEEFLLPKRAKVKLRVTTKISDFNDEEQIEYELLEIDYNL
ncbi:hypothetical protein GCM10008983_09940 [Lentibacillus halophilus]|uniref:DUF6575 domain-containing protein n=1 Tax=Lentibacillus halophilus TaxID=295065 RepID=A0ABP3IZW4_9BACI